MQSQHLDDRDLILAFDHELPARRRAEVDAHLAACAECRSRQAALARGADCAVAAWQSGPSEADRMAAARAALRMKLVAAARERQHALVGPIAAFSGRASWYAVLAMAVVALVVLWRGSLAPEPRVGVPVEREALPVAALTPGAAWNLTTAEVCAPAMREPRPVDDSIRRAVLAGYGMEDVPVDEYELDYLITPELGGAPTVENLWPQRYGARVWNARVKDQLEQLLPRLVCDGAMPLEAAQRDLAGDWVAAYKRHFHTDTPIGIQARADEEGPDMGDEAMVPQWRTAVGPPLQLIAFSALR